jgi:prepilin-type N-terminal cleavage/methylation domain-containing protein
MQKRHAFTLVELLVVIAIIAVLLAVLMPGLQTAKSLAKRLQCAKKMSGIGRAYNMYVEQYQGTLPLLEYWDTAGNAIPSIQSTYLLSRGSSYRHLGCLLADGFIDDGRVLFCPAVDGWYGVPSDAGTNNGTYLGATVPASKPNAGKFADLNTSVNQGWKATKGYCYWPLSKTMCKASDLTGTGTTPHINSSNVGRYKVGLPLNATKINELNMTKPIVTDNKFHSTKMSGWLVDCLFPDGHVSYQRQPKMAGANGNNVQGTWGMHSLDENCQFTNEICNGTQIILDTEKPGNLLTGITPTEFSFQLEQ